MGQFDFPLPGAERNHAADAAWMESLVRVLLAVPPGRRRTEALQDLSRALAAHPDSEALRERIQAFWAHASAVRLLAEVGLPDHQGLAREAFQRVVDRFVPRLDPASDLYAWLDRLGLRAADAEWLATLSPEVAQPWMELLAPADSALGEAAQLLAYRAAALGLSRDLLRLQPERPDLASPFAALPGWVAETRQGAGSQKDLLDCLASCARELEVAREQMEAHGLSTELVFRMDLLEGMLARIHALLSFEPDQALNFAAELVEGTARQHRVRPLLRTGLRRLARKVVEHTGNSGEHYLARDRREFKEMTLAAAGGGALTALTATAKVLIAGLGLAPGLQGLGLAANYAGSFLVMQFLHFSLASKQPAATAAALAGALDAREGQGDDFGPEITLVAAISRGQVAATLGNLA